MLLGNKVRSKCCHAVVRLGYKKIPKTEIRVKLWICTLCKKRDVDILTVEQIKSQIEETDSSTVDESSL